MYTRRDSLPVRMVRRSLSIRYRLPLLICGLLLVVAIASSWAVYIEVRRAALLAARERLANVTRQLSDLLRASGRQMTAQARALAAHPSVVRDLRSPGRQARLPALAALDSAARRVEAIVAIELWAADGIRRLRTERPAPPFEPETARELFNTLGDADSAIVGPYRLVGDSLYYSLTARVLDQGEMLGYVVQHRRITGSSESARQLRELIGSGAALFVGNQRGDLWTDLARPAPPPPVAVSGRGDSLLQYEREAGVWELASAAPIPGTAWMVLTEFPRAPVLAGARRVAWRIVFVTLGLLVLGSAGAWALSRSLTRPLADVAAAAEAIAGGDYAKRMELDRGDELGQLASAFNTMAASVQDSVGKLRAAADRYRRLFESNPNPMWVYDLQSLWFLAVNDAAVVHYGYSPDEFLTMTLKDIRPPAEVPALLENVARPTGTIERAGTWVHRKKDGTLIDVEISSHELEFDGRNARLVLAHDVTDRRRAEEEIRRLNAELEQRVVQRTAELRASEEQFRSLAVTANDAIITGDAHGCVTYVNPGAERSFGYSAAELLGNPLTLLMPERFQEAHRRGLARYLATGEARVVGRTVELSGRRKDGTEFPVELSLASWSRGGEPSFAAIIRDITTRKETDAAIRRSASELEAANKELEAFSYSVSHDLRAPLRGLDGFAQALLEDYTQVLDETGQDYLQRVRAASQRMAALIDDLLDLSRVTRAELRREPVDLSALARGIAADLHKSAPKRKVEFVIPEDVSAHGDRRLLRVVLENLLGNAWKFTAKRSGAAIEFGVTDHDGERVYFVRDNGAGFDMTYADKLFAPFQRLHAPADFEGTGIGLATVQRIVHRHGGRVWAEAGVNRGATISFTLNATPEGRA